MCVCFPFQKKKKKIQVLCPFLFANEADAENREQDCNSVKSFRTEISSLLNPYWIHQQGTLCAEDSLLRPWRKTRNLILLSSLVLMGMSSLSIEKLLWYPALSSPCLAVQVESSSLLFSCLPYFFFFFFPSS